MSTMISPVTHTAETVVNNAVIGGVAVPLSADTGRINSTVPRATANANAVTTAAAG